MERSEVLAALGQAFPEHAIKTRQGRGGRGFRYVETHTVIHRLNSACPEGWSWRITRVEWRPDVLVVTGELEIPGLGSRAGTGIQELGEKTGGGDLIKGAASDALKKAATLFGVGLELYGPDYEAGEIGAAAPAPTNPESDQAAEYSVRDAINLAKQARIGRESLMALVYEQYQRRTLGELTKSQITDLIEAIQTSPDVMRDLANAALAAALVP